jgi:hypothetical protein
MGALYMGALYMGALYMGALYMGALYMGTSYRSKSFLIMKIISRNIDNVCLTCVGNQQMSKIQYTASG